MRQDDVQVLRDLGLNDRAIHDATQVISYFNYINRIADGLGVVPEAFIRDWGGQRKALLTPEPDEVDLKK